ncbi:MAG TPA: cobyrinate a,c-diamide synthase [Noviherbaspirillum sp.]|jgi:cobyrinic acid a,c-diamide synthase|uniref:cobyrinate a,c-diamide synthase n=1 Tax=Noviherbaspirillum sp. TaxID=1926288 RepID=UPI002F92190B
MVAPALPAAAGTATAKAVLVTAAASGQGKTSVTCALARKLAARGQRVRVFKTGPDFLDPMVLERACGAPVGTLDLWMVGEEHCRALLAEAASTSDVILVEGVMGLYDGNPSSADLARRFGLPVLAVVDAGALAQTAGALVLGLRDYGPVPMAGVVANRVAGARHAGMVAGSLRGVPLLGSLPHQPLSLPERHLGLVPPDEQRSVDESLDRMAQQLALDDDAWNAVPATAFTPAAGGPAAPRLLEGRTVAVARDAAFAFLYPANLECLQAMGAAIVFFSPLADEPVPAGANAVYLPGGYPELHLHALSRALHWRLSLHAALAAGTPVYAECGGMMAATGSIVSTEGAEWPMAGLMPGRALMQPHLVAIGPQAWTTDDGELRGHAFHHSRLETPLSPLARAVRHPDGEQGEAIYRTGTLTASYFHAYFPSCPAAAARLFLPAETT